MAPAGSRRAQLALAAVLVVPFAATPSAAAPQSNPPWSHALRFGPLAGWQRGSSGTVGRPLESAAWIARGVRYRDVPTADPPNATLRGLPANAVIVWALIEDPATAGDRPIRLRLAEAQHYACCDAVGVVGGEWELFGNGPDYAYTAVVRVFFGSRPTRAMQAAAQRALDRLELPQRR